MTILVSLFFLMIPWLRYVNEMSGSWFLSRTGRRSALLAAVIGACGTAAMVVADEFWLQATFESLAPVVMRGVVPLVILIAGMIGFRLYLVRKHSACKAEQVQALVVLLLACLASLTVIGVWFRGAGMALVWPWQI